MAAESMQRPLPFEDGTGQRAQAEAPSRWSENSIAPQDRPIHDWYRFVLSFPPHLVRRYVEEFGLKPGATVLDPFCGTGTTVVESKLLGLGAVGIEANPFPHFASCVKTDWSVDPSSLLEKANAVAKRTEKALCEQGIRDHVASTPDGLSIKRLPEETEKILIKDSISPLPLHKTIALLEQINRYDGDLEHKYMVLALGRALVDSIGNLKFGPEVGVGRVKVDVPVIPCWLSLVETMASDLGAREGATHPTSSVHLADARDLGGFLPPGSIDAVITSPPYPNEKDYTRTTRLESAVLGFYEDKMHLRQFKKTLLRSNTRGIYKADNDDRWVSSNPEIEEVANKIERRRIELGKTSGFERLYSRATRLYFGGMARHLAQLRTVLKPDAMLAIVVATRHLTCRS